MSAARSQLNPELPAADVNGLAEIAGQFFDVPDDEGEGERRLSLGGGPVCLI